MTFSEFEQQQIALAAEAFLVKRHPPEAIRPKLDIAVRRDGASVLVVEIRPRWDKPDEIVEQPVAKATYVKTRKVWKVFWMRGDLKWHSYPPDPVVRSIDVFFDLVHEDGNHCFWG